MSNFKKFTKKQLEYIKLSSEGWSSDDIAQKYQVSKASVDILFSYMLKHYNFKSRTHIACHCLRMKLIN